MLQILVESLAKTYRVAERAPGLAGALRGLVRRRWREVQPVQEASSKIGWFLRERPDQPGGRDA